MADVDIKCDNCGNVMTVSGFADPTMISCGSCGEKLRQPTPAATTATGEPKDIAPPDDSGKKLTLQTSDPKPSPEQPPPEQTKLSKKEMRARRKAQAKDDKEKIKQVTTTHTLWAWVLFFVIAGIMGMLRYGNHVDPRFKDTVEAYTKFSTTYAAIILVAFQTLVILKAFKDSVYQGILCFLVPVYSIYYLIAVSDDFYLRAVLLGLLAGIGQDCGMEMQVLGSAAYKTVTAWIASGG